MKAPLHSGGRWAVLKRDDNLLTLAAWALSKIDAVLKVDTGF